MEDCDAMMQRANERWKFANDPWPAPKLAKAVRFLGRNANHSTEDANAETVLSEAGIKCCCEVRPLYDFLFGRIADCLGEPAFYGSTLPQSLDTAKCITPGKPLTANGLLDSQIEIERAPRKLLPDEWQRAGLQPIYPDAIELFIKHSELWVHQRVQLVQERILEWIMEDLHVGFKVGWTQGIAISLVAQYFLEDHLSAVHLRQCEGFLFYLTEHGGIQHVQPVEFLHFDI